MRRTRRRMFSVFSAAGVAIAAAALPLLVPTASSAAPGAAAPARTSIRNTHPTWAVRSAQVATAPLTKAVRARVYLSPRDGAALDREVTAVSTPGSRSYRRFITPAQYRAQYGPAPAAFAKVSAWLKGSGLHVSSPQQNGRYVEVTGSVAN